MAATRTCRKCGSEFSGGALEGLCPSCVGRLAFVSEPEAAAGAGPASHPSALKLRYFGDYELLEEIARGCAACSTRRWDCLIFAGEGASSGTASGSGNRSPRWARSSPNSLGCWAIMMRGCRCAGWQRPPPPIPCNTRARIKIGKLVAIPQKNEEIVKMITQTIRNRLRPKYFENHALAGSTMRTLTTIWR